MLIRVAVCGYAIASRLLELRFSRRNIAGYENGREGPWSRRSYPAMVLLHVVLLIGTLLLGRRRPALLPLAGFLGVQPVRMWIVQSLGQRWNTRAIVPARMELVTNGPYALIRHPNYSVLFVEVFCLPASFGLWRLAVAASAVNAALLWLRIRDEEALLKEVPGYREHFGGKRRFLPGVI